MQENRTRDIGAAVGTVGSTLLAVVVEGDLISRFEISNKGDGGYHNWIRSLGIEGMITDVWTESHGLSRQKHISPLVFPRTPDSGNTTQRDLAARAKKDVNLFVKEFTLRNAATIKPDGSRMSPSEIRIMEAKRDYAERIRLEEDHGFTKAPKPIHAPASINDAVSIYTDASQSRDGSGAAVYGWVRKEMTPNAKSIKYDFAVTKHFDTDQLEALGILSAIVANKQHDNIAIFSDSIGGAKLAQATIQSVRDGGIIENPFIRGHLRRIDLAEALESTTIHVRWVKAHSGDKWNEVVNSMVLKVRHNVDELFMVDYDDLRNRAGSAIAVARERYAD